MYFASPASLFSLTVLLAVVVVSIRAIWLTVVPPRRCVKEASCEKCRYPVVGLNSVTCPECGSNLHQSGIITRSMEMSRRGGLLGAISGMCFLMLLAVLAGMGMIAAAFDGSGRRRAAPTYSEDVLFVYYSLFWGTAGLGALLAIALAFLIVRRRRKLLCDAAAVTSPPQASRPSALPS